MPVYDGRTMTGICIILAPNSYGDPTLDPLALEVTSNTPPKGKIASLRTELCRYGNQILEQSSPPLFSLFSSLKCSTHICTHRVVNKNPCYFVTYMV